MIQPFPSLPCGFNALGIFVLIRNYGDYRLDKEGSLAIMWPSVADNHCVADLCGQPLSSLFLYSDDLFATRRPCSGTII